MAYADSTIGNHGVHLYLNLKQETPVQAKHPYTIDNITLYPNYNLLSQDKDTLNDEMITFDSLRIKQNLNLSKTSLPPSPIQIRKSIPWVLRIILPLLNENHFKHS